MRPMHWTCFIVALLAGYFLGVWMPSYGKSAVKSISSLTGMDEQ